MPIKRAVRQGLGAEQGCEEVPRLPGVQGELTSRCRPATTTTTTSSGGRPRVSRLRSRVLIFLSLRGWQRAMPLRRVFLTGLQRAFLCSSRPPARGRRPTRADRRQGAAHQARDPGGGHHRDANGAPQVPVGDGREAVRDRDRPVLPQRPGQGGADFQGVAVTYAQVARASWAACTPGADREPPHAGHLRRDPPTAGDAPSWGDSAVKEAFDLGHSAGLGADRDAVQVGRQPDPFVTYIPGSPTGPSGPPPTTCKATSPALADGVVRLVIFLAYSGEDALAHRRAGDEISATLGTPG